MYRTFFGDMRPRNEAEILNAIDELGFDIGSAYVTSPMEEDVTSLEELRGWGIEYQDEDGKELVIVGFASKDALIAALNTYELPLE